MAGVSISPDEVATAVAARIRKQLPQRISDALTKQSIPADELEALVQQLATAGLDALTAGWTKTKNNANKDKKPIPKPDPAEAAAALLGALGGTHPVDVTSAGSDG